MARKTPSPADADRYGIGEWYGGLFTALTPRQRTRYARLRGLPKRQRSTPPCPFRSMPGHEVPCTKEGGVCSLRLYQRDAGSGRVSPASGRDGALITTCPHRFEEDRRIYNEVSAKLLGASAPHVLGEIGFLESVSSDSHRVKSPREVGRIDNVLVHPHARPLRWCAMEIQAVYFSGDTMRKEFAALAKEASDPGVPFPVGRRRPDFRSSGPKRLMPQLQIKVPTLRRWGRKMAVVVDERFHNALSPMDRVHDVSNCDIVWFVVRHEPGPNRARLTVADVQLTTLERAVEGLTAGRPVALDTFHQRIKKKLGITDSPHEPN